MRNESVLVEHTLQEREVVGSNRTPKALKWRQWLPCLVLSIIREALVSLPLPNIAQLTSQHLQNPIIILFIFIGGSYGRLAVMLNTLFSLNIEIIIIITTFITIRVFR